MLFTQKKIFEKVHLWKEESKKIVFANGCFDLLHKGHKDLLSKAKKYGDILIVGLNSDSSVKKLKGENRPIQNEIIRAKNLSKLDYVNAVCIFNQNTPIDMYIGIGGGPEGVLAAAALSCYGAQMQTRLVLNEEETLRAQKMGIKDIKKKYKIDEMIRGDVMFCATAITDGDLAEGIKLQDQFYQTTTIALHKNSNTKSIVKNKYTR